MSQDDDGPRAALEAALRDPSKREIWDPWLVYGDWLDAHGDARGRLIALEHRRATATLSDYDARTLAGEIEALVEAEGAAWALPDLPDSCSAQTRHGFVVGLGMVLGDETLDLLERWLALGHGRLLGELRLALPVAIDEESAWEEGPNYVPPPAPPALIERLLSLDLRGLTSLGLIHGSIDDASLHAMVRCEQLAGLRRLDLRYAYLGDSSAKVLASSPMLGELVALLLHRNNIGPEGVAALVHARFAPSLRQLDLRDNPIGPAGAEHLANTERLAGLSYLGLLFDDVEREGARALAASPHLSFPIRRYWSAQYSAQRGSTERA